MKSWMPINQNFSRDLTIFTEDNGRKKKKLKIYPEFIKNAWQLNMTTIVLASQT